MSKASKLINQIWDEKNLVRSDDSTSEIIRKHKLFKEITDAISNDELQRGRDYGGTEEDSIYNDLNECEEILYERALMRHDREAMDYIQDNHVNGTWWMSQALSTAKAAYRALVAYTLDRSADTEIDNAIELLKSISPDEYPVSEDDNED